MISEQVKKSGTVFRGVLLLPINQCSRCGASDDPQDTRHWLRDEDDHLICYRCEAEIEWAKVDRVIQTAVSYERQCEL